jgi:hypothetical protein
MERSHSLNQVASASSLMRAAIAMVTAALRCRLWHRNGLPLVAWAVALVTAGGTPLIAEDGDYSPSDTVAPVVVAELDAEQVGSGLAGSDTPASQWAAEGAGGFAAPGGGLGWKGPVTALTQCVGCDNFHWEFLPRESLYPFYLADPKASRMGGMILGARDDSTLLDATLGGRFGVFRYVNDTPGPFRRGLQIDFEGATQVRLDLDNEHDVRANDFRAGIPVSFSFGRLQMRTGYYHLSSHVGDEFLIKNPGFNRLNYSRDVLFLGAAYWLDEATRIYAETGWAFYSDVSQPWEFLFGIEEAPRFATGLKGVPFYAVNVRLREEVDFGGGLTAQIGLAWRSSYDSGLLRAGFHYFNGKSNQFSFFDDHEEQYGVGIWYDF